MATRPAVATAPRSGDTPAPVPPLHPGHRWPRRLLIGLNIFVAVCLLGAGAVYGYVAYRNNQINRVGVSGLTGESAGDPVTILMVGSDTRSNVKSAQDKKTFGVSQDAGGQRSDTIMLLHLDPGAKTATLMSIPRDLWVQIPGSSRHDRINTTFDNGPDLLIRAIHDDLGIEVNHFAEVDFISFRGIVNSIGAVHVYFPTPARDTFSGLNITRPGCYGLDGNTALQYVRARHYMYYENGRWHQEGESDLARIRRQQDFIRKLASKAVASGLTNPSRLNGVIGSLVPNLTVDSSFHLSDMIRLARRYRTFNPSQLQSTTLPTTPTTIGGADVLLLKEPEATQAINTFLGAGQPTAQTTLPPAPSTLTPSQIHVQVLNGSGRNGQAASVASLLRQSGFQVTGTGSADSYRYITSVIKYGPGQEAKARFLQNLVIGGAQVESDQALTTDVTLITGSSYSGLHPAGGAGTSATTFESSPPTTVAALPGSSASGVEPPCPA